MSMSNYLLMPISKEAFSSSEKTKKAIELLVESKLIYYEAATEVWSYPFRAEEQYYGEEELKHKSLLELYNDIANVKMQETIFKVGFSRYSIEYDEHRKQGCIPGINALTEELQMHMAEFSINNEISPALDIYGHIEIGFFSPNGQDEQGEIRGVGIYCDGSTAYFLEEAGYLNSLNSNLGIYQLLERLAVIYGEKITFQFRN